MISVTYPTAEDGRRDQLVFIERDTLEEVMQVLRDDVPASYRPYAYIKTPSALLDIDGKTRIDQQEMSDRLHFRASSPFAPNYSG